MRGINGGGRAFRVEDAGDEEGEVQVILLCREFCRAGGGGVSDGSFVKDIDFEDREAV